MTTESVLNELTANLGVLYIKLHQHHFYVKGPHFYRLHELFEHLYDEVHTQLDAVAERVLMLDGKPVSTLGEFLSLATIEEAPYTSEKSAETMVMETIADFSAIVNLLVKGIQLDEIDEVTQDMLIGMKAGYDKQLWMLRAYLGQ